MDDALVRSARAAREAVGAGTLRGPALRQALLAVPFRERDAWVDDVLGLGELPADGPDLPREAVPYLPCAVEEILTAVSDGPVHAGDTFVDLGSGLGRVVLLVHLLTGARGLGIELQAHLASEARSKARLLNLRGVSFLEADASEVPLEGTVFFLYAPFSGEMLRRALAQLERVARRHPITVCAVNLELNDVPWLTARATNSAALIVYTAS